MLVTGLLMFLFVLGTFHGFIHRHLHRLLPVFIGLDIETVEFVVDPVD